MAFRDEIERGDVAALQKRLPRLKLDRDVPGLYVPPLMYALRVGQFEAAKIFYDAGAETGSPLAICAGDPNVAGLEWLLDAGADINAPPGALHRASSFKNPEVVALLLDRGADANAVNHRGETALHEAADQGSVDCARLLLDHGAHAGLVGANGMTPSLYAATSHGTRVLALLAERNLLSIDDRDTRGWTPLHHAAADNRERSIAILIKAGADLDARTTKKKASRDFGTKWPARGAALHAAASAGSQRAITALLAANAEIDARDADQNTPLHLACFDADAGSVQTLLDSGADLTVTNKWGWTPLHMSATSHKPEAGRALLASGSARSLRAARTSKAWKAYGSSSFPANSTAADIAAALHNEFG